MRPLITQITNAYRNSTIRWLYERYALLAVGLCIFAHGASAQVTSSSTWQTFPMSNQTGSFTVTFEMVANQNQMDGVTGVVKGTADAFADLACAVRFNPNGQIDARNGSSYDADATINYTSGNSFAVRMEINVPAKTYSVFITPTGQSETVLATDYAFRSEQQSISSLDGWTLLGWIGTHTVSNMVWSTGDTTPPSVPTGLASSNITASSVDLNWNASTDNVGVTGYKVYTNGSNPKSVTGTSTTITGLSASTTYSFTVSAVDAADNESSQGSAVQVTTDSGGGGGGSPIVVSKRVVTSLDDVEEYTSGVIDATSTDVELVYDHGGTGNQTVGLRFTSLGIPQGATINTAYVQFTTDEADSGSTSVTIRGEDVNNAAAFTTTSGNVSSRTVTSASVAWNSIPAWSTAGSAGADQRTPELKSIVQEIVDRSGFGASSAMAFIITGSGSRTAESYDGSPSQAPLLYIEYTTGGGGGGGGQSPYGGTAAAIPGRIDAENYDLGGQNVAYFDTTTGNTGGQYRSDDIDILQKNGAYVVGYTANGEWLEYTVNVQSAGTYDLDLRYARGVSGSGAVRVLVGGVDKTGSIAIPSTGSWNTWTTITKTGVELSAGQQIMRLQIDTGQLDINWVEFTESSGGTPIVVSKRVAASLDDAEEYASGSIDATSTDLELVYDHAGTNNQTVGMRFTSLGIPQGATINTAYIQFTTDEADSVATSVTIRGEDVNNAAAFTTASGNISGRTVTSASVAWNSIPAWSTAGSAGADQRTPELKSIVQEIVNRAGFGTSSAMAFIITGSGTRTAESYDGSSSQAPLLYIEYTGGGGGGGDTTPPTAPTNLVATAVSSSQINLSWTAATDNVGVAGYDIYRGGQYRATVSNTTYQDTGLNPDTTYSYVVYAFDAADNISNASNTAQATTDEAGHIAGCNNLQPGQLGAGQSISITAPVLSTHYSGSSNSVPAQFNWTFNSGGGDAYCGKFANGDYWLAPKDGSTVQITALTTNNSTVGLDADPIMEATGLLQGYGNYSSSENLMNALPVAFSSTTSLVAAKRRNQQATSACGTAGTANGCVDAYHIITILPAVPTDNGATMIRPNITGQTKALLTLADFDFSRLPNATFLNGTNASGLENIRIRWSHSTGIFGLDLVPWVGEAGRAWRPHIIHHDYGAGMAQTFNNDLMVVFSSDNTLPEKTPALAAMIAWGLDMYHARYNGPAAHERGWASGAGQHAGNFLPPVFMAALRIDQTYANTLSQVGPNTHSTLVTERGPQELRQISEGANGEFLWGDVIPGGPWEPGSVIPTSAEEEARYWWNVFNAQCYLNAPGTCNVGGSNNAIRSRSLRDPYGYHDGGPRLAGEGYIQISLGSQNALAAATCLMDEIHDIVNYPPLLEYVDRARSHGTWTQPDPCAAPHPSESSSCDPTANNWQGANCNYYRVTWGPDPSDPGDCIQNGVGRFASNRHGVSLTPLYASPQVQNNWTAIRALCP